LAALRRGSQSSFRRGALAARSSFAVTTSDEFFSTLRPSKRYDVAFIDGLHTFEQTYRDVINTFAHLRSG